MYTIEHLSDESWTPEVTRETEFKAFVDARTKCMATGKIYRVVDDKKNVRYTITLDACKKQLFSNR
jgi:RAB protein geranylgeranyltransferase component A|tara:strand:+ start:2605 stop:2802 length:198 start_codon:yes stop_codon:yes gene_type:complete